MSKRKIFVYIWPLIVLAGIPLTMHIWFVGKSWPQLWQIYADSFFTAASAKMPALHYLYAFFAFSALLASLVRWLRRPGKTSMICTVFTGWILCGFPAVIMLGLLSFMQNWRS